ncbi:hypothetical protein HK100_002845 [Physocladia obscura]|uniref:endo-polygalacturonase n=1 Tax=Physocladia obscura TaxID=109957 RepID=A0AAD5XDK9_9FUNG|nr:hypothetical protein HK100_002845 [Physocladia obscura]
MRATVLLSLVVSVFAATTSTKHHGHTGHHTSSTTAVTKTKTTAAVRTTTTTTAAVQTTTNATAAVVPQTTTTTTTTVATSAAVKTALATTTIASIINTSGACVVSSYAGFASCASSTKILIQGPFTVPAENVINLSLKSGATVILSGTVTFAKSTTLTGNDHLLTVTGSGITFESDPSNQGILYGNGQLYWDGKGANGGVNKPKFVSIRTTGSTFKGIKVINSPVHCFSIGGSSNLIDGITFDNSAGASLGHNTDGFDVSGTDITVQNSWVHNQDDCLAINNANGVNFLNNICIGGHGASVGSVQSGAVVENVYIQNITIADSDNGVRVKTVYGATSGLVSNITYQDITLSNIAKFGVVVRQDYLNGGPTGKAAGQLPIKGLTLKNVHGSVTGQSVFILCATGECSEFNFSEIAVAPVKASCSGISPAPTGC